MADSVASKIFVKKDPQTLSYEWKSRSTARTDEYPCIPPRATETLNAASTEVRLSLSTRNSARRSALIGAENFSGRFALSKVSLGIDDASLEHRHDTAPTHLGISTEWLLCQQRFLEIDRQRLKEMIRKQETRLLSEKMMEVRPDDSYQTLVRYGLDVHAGT